MGSVARFFPAILGLLAFSAGAAQAQDYPTKPIHVFTATAGGGNDVSARLIGAELSARLGQPIIVENRPPQIATETAVRMPADGYTLLFQSDSLWTLPFIQSVSYDPVKDFAPISLTGRTPTVLVINPSVPANSVKELIDLAKSKPGQINYATSGFGSATHLAAEQFKAMAGIDLVAVQFPGGPPAVASLLGGEVQVMFAVANTITPQIKSGQLRALGVASLEPSSLLPGIPTVASSGLPGFRSASTQGFFAPAKVPPAIIARLNKEILAVIQTPAIKERMLSIGVETVGTSPEEFGAYVKSEMASAEKLVKSSSTLRPN